MNYIGAEPRGINLEPIIFWSNFEFILECPPSKRSLREKGDIYLFEAAQKERHPALDAGSPFFDMIRRSRIGVRDDEIDNFSAIPRSFWTASELTHLSFRSACKGCLNSNGK